MTPMTLLVTGGGGFVMSNVVRQVLESDSAARAIVFDLGPLDALATRFFQPVHERVTYVQGDVTDSHALREAAAGRAITHILHGATVTHVPGGDHADPTRFIHVNVMGTLAVVELARTLKDLRRCVYVSSGAIYGSPTAATPTGPQPESGPINPEELYGISKFTAEQITRRYGELFNLDVCSVRFSSVFGPMERPTATRLNMSLPCRMMAAALAARPLPITAETVQAGGDFLSAEDVAQALTLLLRKERLSHAAYNIAFGAFTPVQVLFSIFKAVMPEFEYAVVAEGEAEVALPANQRLARHNAYSIERLTAETGWRPRPLNDQFASYCEWAKRNLHA